MSKTLDFNSIVYPALELVMPDADRTVIKVSTPSEALVEELQVAAKEMQAVLESGNADSIKAVYDLAARLINCNRSGITVTVDDLRNKYKLNLEALLVFFSSYMDFISDLNNAKN